MSDAISIDLGSALLYLEDKVRALVGRDEQSLEIRTLLSAHLRFVAADVRAVQVIGMARPVWLRDIYQPTRLLARGPRATDEPASLPQLLTRQQNAVIFGRPGQGKSTALSHLFLSKATDDAYLPLLFVLRRPGAIDDLSRFVDAVAERKLPRQTRRVVVLVDGFDEVARSQRRDIATVLRKFAALDIGNFLVTCREFYEVDDLPAEHFDLQPFSHLDAAHFVSALSKAYGAPLEPADLLDELGRAGLGEFAVHPLLLALVCIVKANSSGKLPRTKLELVAEAIDILTRRWDREKGLDRELDTTIGGISRVGCMKAVAYDVAALVIPWTWVDAAVRRYLPPEKVHATDVRTLMSEVAGWFGVLIPTAANDWTFVQRFFHDYLAALFWIEKGFRPSEVQRWDSRAALAMAMLPDATEAMVQALGSAREMAAFLEAVAHGAHFRTSPVAAAFVEHFRSFCDVESTRRGDVIDVQTQHDVFDRFSDQFLSSLVLSAVERRGAVADVVTGYVVAELKRRHLRLPFDAVLPVLYVYGAQAKFSVQRRAQLQIVALAEVT